MIKFGTVTFGIFVVAALGLSGCGAIEKAIQDRIDDEEARNDGGQTPEVDNSEAQAPNAFDNLLTLSESLERNLSPFEPATNMPPTGLASYRGVAAILLPEQSLLSRVALQADFGAGKIEGSFSDFVTPSGAQVSGTLAVSNGAISGSDLAFDVNGALSGGGIGGAVTASASANAGFIGDGAQGVDGDLAGTYTATGQAGAPITGRFLAERTP